MHIVAEIGCNHMGEEANALKMIDVARASGAHAVKFQKRTPQELLTSEQYAAPHPYPANSYGETYGAHREFLELDAVAHARLKAHCDEVGIVYSTSVWDVTSAREMVALAPAFLKVGSPSNLHFEMQRVLRDEYAGDVHLSLGMTTAEELERIMAFWEGHWHRLVLYACTSGYPVQASEVCLLQVRDLRARYGDAVKGIGFSGHHLGIALDVAAQALGAEWCERHFTLDRTLKGTDHAASLEPTGLQKLCRDVKSVTAAMQPRPDGLVDVEKPMRKKLKFETQTK